VLEDEVNGYACAAEASADAACVTVVCWRLREYDHVYIAHSGGVVVEWQQALGSNGYPTDSIGSGKYI
jgi:hypothetical protein